MLQVWERKRDETFKNYRSTLDCIIGLGVLDAGFFCIKQSVNLLQTDNLNPYSRDLSQVFAGIREQQGSVALADVFFFNLCCVSLNSGLVFLSLWVGNCVSFAGEDICWAGSSRTRAGRRWWRGRGGGTGTKGLWGRLVKPLCLPLCSGILNYSTEMFLSLDKCKGCTFREDH